MLFVFVAHSGVQHAFTMRVTWQVALSRQELLTLPEHLRSPPAFYEVRAAHCFVFSYYVSVRSELGVVMFATISS